MGSSPGDSEAARDPRRGRHRLLLELGRGGMGTVYLALVQGPGGFHKLKVVKRLRPDLASDPQFLQMFLDEARLSARLNHSNVVQTFEVGFDGVNYFLEMEYLEGQSFDAIWRRAARSGGVPLGLGLWVLHEALEGLHYAHELRDADGEPLRVVHRDVSPHNLFVTYDGAVKVLDFGIAKAADSSSETRTGVVKGKATYMAPEQAARAPLDRRADVFAVGVMLWQLVTGARMWGELGDTEIFAKLRAGEIPPVRAMKADAPAPLVAICEKALAHDPEHRYATAADMQADIEAYLETTGTRVGNKALGAWTAELFADRRKAVQAEVDAQLREPATTVDRGVDVPVLMEADAVRATRSDELSSARTMPQGARAASERRPPPTPAAVPRPRWLLPAAGALAVSLAAGAYAVRARNVPPAMAPASSACATDGDCAGTTGVCVASACVARSAVECVSNRDCATKPEASICAKRRHACVPLASDGCVVHAEPGDADDDQTLWLGAMFPTSGPDGEAFGRSTASAFELARRDFASVSKGLPARRAGGAPRPIAVVECDDTRDPARAARHLVDDVGVPAVVGFYRSQEVVDLATSIFVPRGVVTIASLNRGASITRVASPADGPRLVWRTATNAAQAAAPTAHIVSDVYEPELRAGAVGEREPLRVALVRSNGPQSLSFADSFFSALRFNGKSIVENGDAFHEVVFADPAAGTAVDFGAVVKSLLAFAPHVVVYLDNETFTDNVLLALEQAWPPRRVRPRYASSGILRGEKLFAFLGRDADRRRRFRSAELAANTPANVKFTLHYNEVFTPKVTPGTAPGNPYDSFYLLAYAAAAIGDAPITGAALATAFRRFVPPGVPVDVGPARVLEVFELLGQGKNVDLQGTATTLDFDLVTGEPTSVFAIYCAKANAEGLAYDTVESGLTYDAARNVLVGTSKCD